MELPPVPDARPIDVLSPTLYAAMLQCRAKALWVARGNRSSLPPHPKALLGICMHSLMAQAHRGYLAGDDQAARLVSAKASFDMKAQELWTTAHPLLKAKFGQVQRLPYYNLCRERAAIDASAVETESHVQTTSTAAPSLQFKQTITETNLVSKDGLVAGRPDHLDRAARHVTDYKSSAEVDGGQEVTPAEERQLRLYAHLAEENGIPIERGFIARSDGRQASIAIGAGQAEAEGRRARAALADYNRVVTGQTFESVAQPSAENCAFCPCIPFCAAFWKEATPAWGERCGRHIEGRIAAIEESSIQGVTLKTFRLDGCRGTIEGQQAFVEQVPERWITADGSMQPEVGDLMRVVSGKVEGESSPPVVRVDRVASALWTVPATAAAAVPAVSTGP